jgi:hypothetical protein
MKFPASLLCVFVTLALFLLAPGRTQSGECLEPNGAPSPPIGVSRGLGVWSLEHLYMFVLSRRGRLQTRTPHGGSSSEAVSSARHLRTAALSARCGRLAVGLLYCVGFSRGLMWNELSCDHPAGGKLV